MNQILEEENMKYNLKKCLESFEIVQNKKQKISKKNLYQYLLKKHFEMETNNDKRFSNKQNKMIPTQNIPFKRKNESFSSVNHDRVFSQQETTQQILSEKFIGNGKRKQEYEHLLLMRSGKQSFKARISEVYLDQPLVMIIFENQEMVKNNTKLKKQLAVQNNVLLNFFKEVNAKCNILKLLIFENEISNAKFFFTLLQNNIYSIEQYLKKRGIDGTVNQNTHSQELSNFLPLNQRKSILQFQIIHEQKCANTLIDLSKLLKNQPISPNRKNIQTYDKLPRLSVSYQGQPLANENQGKRYSIPTGVITQNQVSNIFSLPNEDLKDDQKSVNQSTQFEEQTSINDFQDSKQQNLGNEQNNTDYINRMKIKEEYNLGNIFSKMQFNKQIHLVLQTTENTPQKIDTFPKNPFQIKCDDKGDHSPSIASNSPDFQQIFSFLPENNKLQQNQINSSNKLTNGNHLNAEDKLQSQPNKVQKKENNQSDQAALKILKTNDKQNERSQNELLLNQNLLSYAHSPSASNFSIQHNQTNIHSYGQQEFTSFVQERTTQVEINTLTNKRKSKSCSEKPQNPKQMGKEKNRGNVRQFDFQNILDDINIFRNEINMKLDPSLLSIKIFSDKDMILYILRSLLSSVLVINEIRKQQTANLKIKTFQNLNKVQQPVGKRKLLNEHPDKITIKQNQNDLNYQKFQDNENQSHQSLIIKNTPNQKPFKISDTNNISDDNRRDSNHNIFILHKDQASYRFIQENINSNQKLKATILSSDNIQKINSIQSDQLTNTTYRDISTNTKRNSEKSKQNNNDKQSLKKNEEGKKQLFNNQSNKHEDNQVNENKKSSFTFQKDKLQNDDKTSIEDINKKSRKDLNQYCLDNQQDIENIIDCDDNQEIPFSMNEVDVEFSLEKNKYCQSLVVSLNNITKEEILSCLNLNSNKAVSQVEYEIIKLVIQKIGPHPLYFEARKVCLAFLLDLSEVVEGQSFFNMQLELSNPQQQQQQEQMLFQIPEEECDIPHYLLNNQLQINEFNENNGLPQ